MQLSIDYNLTYLTSWSPNVMIIFVLKMINDLLEVIKKSKMNKGFNSNEANKTFILSKKSQNNFMDATEFRRSEDLSFSQLTIEKPQIMKGGEIIVI